MGGAGLVGVLLLRQVQNTTHAQGDPRGYIWVVAVDMFKQHPLLGNGPGTYGLEFMRHYSIPPAMLLAHAHNFVLNTLGEMGAAGALALAALTIGIVITLWRAWHKAPVGKRGLTAALIASLVGLAVHSQFDTPETVVMISLLTAVILGLLAGALPGKPAATSDAEARWLSWPLWLGMIAAVGLWGFSNSSYTAFSQGLAASYRSDWQTAAYWMDETVRREPALAFTWFQDGFAHGMLALNPDGSLRDQRELRTALAAYENGMQLEDANSLNWANLGRLRLAARDEGGAVEAFAQAARLAKNSIVIQLEYVLVLEKLQPDAQSRAVYLAALERQRSLYYNLYFNFSMWRQVDLTGFSIPVPEPMEAWLALEKGELSQAVDLFRTQESGNEPYAYIGLGRALMDLGDYPGAERALRTAEFLGGDALAVNQALVWLYSRMDEPEKLAQARARVDDLLERTSVYGPGRMGESPYAWYIYHRESLPLDLLP
jgi:tetratricopeptide (TPR) repeat protein